MLLVSSRHVFLVETKLFPTRGLISEIHSCYISYAGLSDKFSVDLPHTSLFITEFFLSVGFCFSSVRRFLSHFLFEFPKRTLTEKGLIQASVRIAENFVL